MLKKHQKRIIRHKRVRAKVSGTALRPRLAVFRSNRHIHLQLIDDEVGKTLVSASTVEIKQGKDRAPAAAKLLVERAVKLGISVAVFDRGGYKFHGQVAKVAAAAREGGLKI